MSVRYFYGREEDGRPRITYAIVDGGGNDVLVGIAICNSAKDSFVKAIGRNIAKGRAEVRKSVLLPNYLHDMDSICKAAILRMEKNKNEKAHISFYINYDSRTPLDEG